MKICSITRQGVAREKNEDRYLVKDFANKGALVAVADGMGGHAAGEMAAQIAIGSLEAFDSEAETLDDQLVELILAAKMKISDEAAANKAFEGMGTTLSAAFVTADHAHWAHVGDSRLYLFRRGVLIQISDDHTLVGFLQNQGEITEEEAREHPFRNVLLSCLGCGEIQIDTGAIRLEEKDILILSTDGAHDVVPKENMESFLGTEAGLEEKLEALIRAALEAGSGDDMTLVGVEI